MKKSIKNDEKEKVSPYKISKPDIHSPMLRDEYLKKLISYHEFYYKLLMTMILSSGVGLFLILAFIGIVNYYNNLYSYSYSILFFIVIYVGVIILMFTAILIKLLHRAMIHKINDIYKKIEEGEW